MNYTIIRADKVRPGDTICYQADELKVIWLREDENCLEFWVQYQSGTSRLLNFDKDSSVHRVLTGLVTHWRPNEINDGDFIAVRGNAATSNTLFKRVIRPKGVQIFLEDNTYISCDELARISVIR